MRQHYELGQWLRNHYKNLLVNDYTRDDIYIQSTDVDRTLMSAMSNLAGMYPPTERRQFDENLAWAPIPVHTIPEHEDYVSWENQFQSAQLRKQTLQTLLGFY